MGGGLSGSVEDYDVFESAQVTNLLSRKEPVPPRRQDRVRTLRGTATMTMNHTLSGRRFRHGESVRVEALLLGRVDDSRWRARICGPVEVGDRLRFGESSESMACLLGFLDADIVEISGEDAVLAFHFTGPALDEALERLSRS